MLQCAGCSKKGNAQEGKGVNLVMVSVTGSGLRPIMERVVNYIVLYNIADKSRKTRKYKIALVATGIMFHCLLNHCRYAQGGKKGRKGKKGEGTWRKEKHCN